MRGEAGGGGDKTRAGSRARCREVPGAHAQALPQALRRGSHRPPPAPVKKAKGEDETPLWVNKYKPNQPAQLIGNGAKIAELRKFLTTWEDVHLKGPEVKGKDKPMKSVLISGAPGVGKSSAATIIAKQLGFEVVEVNARIREAPAGRM